MVPWWPLCHTLSCLSHQPALLQTQGTPPLDPSGLAGKREPGTICIEWGERSGILGNSSLNVTATFWHLCFLAWRAVQVIPVLSCDFMGFSETFKHCLWLEYQVFWSDFLQFSPQILGIKLSTIEVLLPQTFPFMDSTIQPWLNMLHWLTLLQLLSSDVLTTLLIWDQLASSITCF